MTPNTGWCVRSARAKTYVDKMAAAGNQCDFVQEVAVNYPLYVIMSLLGLPESDFPRMLTLTQELFGGDDEELLHRVATAAEIHRAERKPGADRHDVRRRSQAPADSLRACLSDWFWVRCTCKKPSTAARAHSA